MRNSVKCQWHNYSFWLVIENRFRIVKKTHKAESHLSVCSGSNHMAVIKHYDCHYFYICFHLSDVTWLRRLKPPTTRLFVETNLIQFDQNTYSCKKMHLKSSSAKRRPAISWKILLMFVLRITPDFSRRILSSLKAFHTRARVPHKNNQRMRRVESRARPFSTEKLYNGVNNTTCQTYTTENCNSTDFYASVNWVSWHHWIKKSNGMSSARALSDGPKHVWDPIVVN